MDVARMDARAGAHMDVVMAFQQSLSAPTLADLTTASFLLTQPADAEGEEG